ncbi:hypothetical protein BU26DRAFT_490206 [Trematosphaeria pertusa]|uniref:Uncharacterized protein n=1 Tax=Trematosphaeria pertusa TaxID=390896 RepID=A0A6A6I549_9PLEO|nr:uncharacterized protein BU26DRAFT_490206 [Trematosphaeria pertusa]KAF2245082.1 hypothetical protein BU26DRAFT_490206 [Trematosphaeria pertusa]
MSATKIVSSAAIKTIQKSGKDIALKYATMTEAWQRTYLATSEQNKFSAAIEKTDVPSNTATAILVEKPHESQNDSRTHFTTVLQDDKGNHIKTQHIPV